MPGCPPRMRSFLRSRSDSLPRSRRVSFAPIGFPRRRRTRIGPVLPRPPFQLHYPQLQPTDQLPLRLQVRPQRGELNVPWPPPQHAAGRRAHADHQARQAGRGSQGTSRKHAQPPLKFNHHGMPRVTRRDPVMNGHALTARNSSRNSQQSLPCDPCRRSSHAGNGEPSVRHQTPSAGDQVGPGCAGRDQPPTAHRRREPPPTQTRPFRGAAAAPNAAPIAASANWPGSVAGRITCPPSLIGCQPIG